MSPLLCYSDSIPSHMGHFIAINHEIVRYINTFIIIKWKRTLAVILSLHLLHHSVALHLLLLRQPYTFTWNATHKQWNCKNKALSIQPDQQCPCWHLKAFLFKGNRRLLFRIDSERICDAADTHLNMHEFSSTELWVSGIITISLETIWYLFQFFHRI